MDRVPQNHGRRGCNRSRAAPQAGISVANGPNVRESDEASAKHGGATKRRHDETAARTKERGRAGARGAGARPLPNTAMCTCCSPARIEESAQRMGLKKEPLAMHSG